MLLLWKFLAMGTTTTQWILELVDKLTAPMKNIMGTADELAEKVERVGVKAEVSREKITKLSEADLHSVTQSVENLVDKLDILSEPEFVLNSQMKAVIAVAGATGAALDGLGEKAENLANDFRGDNLETMETYRSALSGLAADAEYDHKALLLMEQSSIALGNAMQNGGADAKSGASGVAAMSEALMIASGVIKRANLSLVEACTSIQAWALGVWNGTVAVLSLQGILNRMAGLEVVPQGAQEKLSALGVSYEIVSNKMLLFAARLQDIQKAQAGAALLDQQLGADGRDNSGIQVKSADAQDKVANAGKDTNSAAGQTNVAMGSWSELMGNVPVWFDSVKKGFEDVTSQIFSFLKGISDAVDVVENLAKVKDFITEFLKPLNNMSATGKLVAACSSIVSGGFALMSTAARGLGVAIMNIPIIGWIAAIISALIAVGVYFYKTSATFRGVLMGVWNFIKTFFTGVASFIGEVFKGIWHLIKGVFNPANWFDKNYKFSDGFDKIAGAAKKFGRDLSKAYSEGKKQGEESFYEENPEKRPKSAAANAKGRTPEVKKPTMALTGSDFRSGSAGRPGEMQSSGGASIRSITQKIDIKNYFTINRSSDAPELEGIAEKVVRVINDKLRDSVIAVN